MGSFHNQGDFKVVRAGSAEKVIFLHGPSEGTCLDNVLVTIFENRMVDLESATEVTTTSLEHVEIVWRILSTDGPGKIVSLRPGL